MSWTMSWLKPTSSLLRNGSRVSIQGSLMSPVRAASTPAAADIRRIAQGWARQPPNSVNRPYSTQKPAKSGGQPSRFRRPEVSSLPETPNGAADQTSQGEAGSSTTDGFKPLIATIPATAPEPVDSAAPPRSPVVPQTRIKGVPPPRKPVDTSSKEYKQAASRYVRLVVGLPVLLVTSYFLYKRLEPQIKIREVPTASTPSQESNSES